MNKKQIYKKNFLKKKLNKSKFENNKINVCNFWECSLVNSIFKNVEISNSVFTDANLKNSLFKNCVIKNSNFSHSIVTGCDFSSTKMINVNFRDAVYDDKTKWPPNFDLKKAKIYNFKNYNPYDYKVKMSFENIKRTSNKELKKFKNKILKDKDDKIKKAVKKIIFELTEGKGYIIIKNFYSKRDTKIAEDLILKQIKKTKNFRKAMYEYSVDKILKSININGLLNLNKVFNKMIQPNIAMEAFKILMGQRFFCTWYAAQCSLPQTRGQNLHLDYPYVVANHPNEKIPFGMGSNSFLLSCGILTYLNDYDKNNYGPILLDNSHKYRKFPSIENVKNKSFVQVKIPRGGILILNSLLWHAGMPNYSEKKIRTLLVAHYTPEFVKPRYDLKKETKKSIIDRDKKYLKQLIV